jgi:hypothetical protein
MSTVLRALMDAAGARADEWRIIDSDVSKDLLLDAALEDGTYAELVPPVLAELDAAGERFWLASSPRSRTRKRRCSFGTRSHDDRRRQELRHRRHVVPRRPGARPA